MRRPRRPRSPSGKGHGWSSFYYDGQPHTKLPGLSVNSVTCWLAKGKDSSDTSSLVLGGPHHVSGTSRDDREGQFLAWIYLENSAAPVRSIVCQQWVGKNAPPITFDDIRRAFGPILTLEEIPAQDETAD